MALTLTQADIGVDYPSASQVRWSFNCHDPAVALTEGSQVLFQTQVKLPPESFDDSGSAYLASVVVPVNSAGYAGFNYNCLKRSGEFRIRVGVYVVGSPTTFTDWQVFDLPSSGASATLPPTSIARILPYKTVRDGVIERYFSTTPTATEMQRIARFITAANRQAHQGYSWSELIVTEEIDCDDGKVLWADVQGADHRWFYTADPRPANSNAIEILEKTADADGIWLTDGAVNRTTVWAVYVPRLPVYTSEAVVAETTYDLGSMVYDDDTGHCYECVAESGALGSDLDDTDQWRARPVLWIVQDVIEALAESSLLERSQERGQAATVRANAEGNLQALQCQDLMKKHGYPRR